MLEKVFEFLYVKVFVNIVLKRSTTVVYVEVNGRKGLQRSAQEEFETTLCTDKMQHFITSFIKESPFYYISVLDTSYAQGAVPTCVKNKMRYYTDLEDADFHCYNNRWAFYTARENILSIKKRYEAVGVDYIFSPFSILSSFFQDKIDGDLAMYILIDDGYVSLSIFEKSQLLFAEYLDVMQKDEWDGMHLDDAHSDDADTLLSEDSGMDLNEMVLDDDEMGDLEDFTDIEDLDSIDDIEDFSTSEEKRGEESLPTEDLMPSDESEFNLNYQRFTLIQHSVGRFYKDPRYRGDFIENVYIADSIKLSSELKKYLEEEMFFNVYIRRIDLPLEICELAKKESRG